MAQLTSGQAFVTWDRLLDTTRLGPMYLRQPEVAEVVRKQLAQVETDGWCSIDAWVIMPNHVHVLWTPQAPLADLVRKVKGSTAVLANRLISRSGPFWQDEYFDRILRNEQECLKVRHYIEWNPVNAGLVATPEEFVWSSASTAEAARGLKPTPQIPH